MPQACAAVQTLLLVLAYAKRRFAGGCSEVGVAERVLGMLRKIGPLLGWSRLKVARFLQLEDPAAQIGYWRQHLDTRAFRAAINVLFAFRALRAAYAAQFLDSLPAQAGAVMRRRIERCITLHPNRQNPFLSNLFCGPKPERQNVEGADVRFECADAVSFLEREPPGSYSGFALSNILDGASRAYARGLFSALERAAAPGAIAVLRSFREPRISIGNHAARDRSILWGLVRAEAPGELGDSFHDD